jgi:hypothetical protein
MNGNISEVHASRMMLLMAPVSARALSRCYSLLTMRLATHYQLNDYLLCEMIFGSLALLVLKGLEEGKNLEEVNMYS